MGANIRDPEDFPRPSFRRTPESSLVDKILAPGFRRGDNVERVASPIPLSTDVDQTAS
jgi:hypothetical protein